MQDMSCGLYLKIAYFSVDAAATLQAYPPGAEAAGLHPPMPCPAEDGIGVEPHAKRAKLSGEQLVCQSHSDFRRQAAAVLPVLMLCHPVPLVLFASLPICLARSKICLELCHLCIKQQECSNLHLALLLWHFSA